MDRKPTPLIAPNLEAPQWRGAGRMLAWTALILLLAMYCLLAPRTTSHDDKDWTHLWLGGRMVAAGYTAQLYDHVKQVEVYRQADPRGEPPPVWEERNRMFGCFNYPPPAALAYAGLAWLPMRTAAVVNAYLNIAVAVLAAWLLAHGLGRPNSAAAVAVAVLAYPAFFINLSLGQNAVFTMAVVLAAWCLCERRRELTAGVVLGLLICKPNWLFAVGWIPLIHGRWRMLLGVAAGAASAVAVTALVVGLQPFQDYFAVLQGVAGMQDLPAYYLDVQYSAFGVFRKGLGLGRAADSCAWASCALVVLATWKATHACWVPGTPGFRRAMACCLMASLWVNPHLNYYDLLLTAPCAAVLLLDWPDLGRSARAIALAAVVLAYVAIPWDHTWALRRIVPVPSLVILVLWGWFACRSAALLRSRYSSSADVVAAGVLAGRSAKGGPDAGRYGTVPS